MFRISLCSSSEKAAAVFLASRIFLVYSEVRSMSDLMIRTTAVMTESNNPKGLVLTTAFSNFIAWVAAPTPCVKAMTVIRPKIMAVRYAVITALPTPRTACQATVAILTRRIHE